MGDTGDYCRKIETYLCQKNGGHLVRIVGPAFEKVRGWADQGVPLKVAFRGIDRCCERANARGGGRRRPMRIEFCEADILEAFDDWRRAIGVTAGRVAERGDTVEAPRRGPLVTHIQRCVTRLLAPAGIAPDAEYDATIRSVIAELDDLAARARQARGDERTAMIDRLSQLDSILADAARKRMDAKTLAALQTEADAELSGFAARMPADERARARRLAVERLLRDALNLPVLVYE
jgi:hypothetical protein